MKPAARTGMRAGALLIAWAAALAVPAQESRPGFSVKITEPANQQVVFGRTKIAAAVEISDPDLLDRLEFVVGDDVVFVDREPPFECFHDFGEASKTWVIRVVARHKEGVTASDAVITRQMKFAAIESVNRVILWVAATDKEGEFVTDLAPADFRVLEDGVERPVIDFYHETRPITLAFLIDTSGSMADKIEDVHAAAQSLVDSLRPIDQALVIDFDDNVFLIQDLTQDREALREAITSTEPIGGTAIHDAVHAAYRKIGELDGRKAMVLLSDGEDTSSQFGYARVIEEAKANNTMLFTIGLGGGYGGAPNRGVLKEFAEVTGGRFFFAKKPEELAEAYRRIAEELGKQYFLTYSSDNETWDGRWIEIDVESARPGVKIRARRGYFAVRSSPGRDD